MQKLIILLAVLSVSGCASLETSQTNLTQVTVAKDVSLNATDVWPLKNKGTYLQKVTATIKGESQSFSVYLTVDNRQLEAIAFNDIAGRLYSLKWTPEQVSWEGSTYIPSEMMPENIIADFLMAQLPLKQLQTNLNGASVIEKNENGIKVRVVQNHGVIRIITYNKPLGDLWGRLVIDNPAIGYKLDIQTVIQ